MGIIIEMLDATVIVGFSLVIAAATLAFSLWLVTIALQFDDGDEDW